MQYGEKKCANLLWYRNEYTRSVEYRINKKIGDVFDGVNYKNLVNTGFFGDFCDVALLGSSDSFQIFRQSRDDCWVVLLINANLPPEVHVK